jgi:hypothetical protein
VTAVIITFPLHPVRIIRDEGAGDWLVSWRGLYWQHATHTAALPMPAGSPRPTASVSSTTPAKTCAEAQHEDH